MSSCPLTGEPRCKCKFEVEPIEEPTVKEMLRKLFTDHANYTHLYIISEVSDLPNLKEVTARLLANQTDIALAVKPIFGPTNSKKLEELLKKHILGASEAVKKAKAGKSMEKVKAKIFANSTQVSELISSINPEVLPFEEVKMHFDEHNKYVLEIATLYLKGEYEEVLQEYDCYYNHMLGFSDLLSLLA